MFDEKVYLHIPGPSPVPPQVQRAMARPMIGHRSGDFSKLVARLGEEAKKLFRTAGDVLTLTGSGTAGMEACVAGVVSPGDEVLVLVSGVFGERWAKIAQAYGAKVTRLDTRWGTPIDPHQVAVKLAENPRFKAVFATQNETSTTVQNDIAAIGAYVAKTEAVFVVDCVSSLGGADFRMDEWQVDLAVAGSQKCLMLPPGLALVAVSPKAWKAIEGTRSSRFYLDLVAYRDSLAKATTPYTPAVSLYFGLEAALALLFEEGLENSFRRHDLMKRMVRRAIRALGLSLLAEDAWASPTVTGVWAPEGLNPDDFRARIKKRYGVVLAGGQKDLTGKIFRIGHMGYTSPYDLLGVVAAVELGLKESGYPASFGTGVAAAQAELFDSLDVAAGKEG
ncbi:MAG: alanine--glyoxylate aminotransferase family protein [Bacillota bacterium]|nr:alanine--glyoxylate aminotransferase family protein [Bacillota bacterium]